MSPPRKLFHIKTFVFFAHCNLRNTATSKIAEMSLLKITNISKFKKAEYLRQFGGAADLKNLEVILFKKLFLSQWTSDASKGAGEPEYKKKSNPPSEVYFSTSIIVFAFRKADTTVFASLIQQAFT